MVLKATCLINIREIMMIQALTQKEEKKKTAKRAINVFAIF